MGLAGGGRGVFAWRSRSRGGVRASVFSKPIFARVLAAGVAYLTRQVGEAMTRLSANLDEQATDWRPTFVEPARAPWRRLTGGSRGAVSRTPSLAHIVDDIAVA